MNEAACRPLALITAIVLSGVVIGRLAGRKVKELFLDVSGDASEYDDLECLCLLSSRLELLAPLISLDAGLRGRSVKVSAVGILDESAATAQQPDAFVAL